MPAWFLENRKAKAKEQNTGIIGANSSKIHLVFNYNSYVHNEIEQCRIVKGRVAPLKFLFYVVTQIEKDQYTLIKQSVQ